MRGQVTIFIVLGILVVAGISLFFILRENQNEGSQVLQNPIFSQVSSCLEETTNNAITVIAAQGGYFYPANYISFYPYKVPYYLDEGIVSVPSLSEVENSFSNYIEENLDNCTNNFETLRKEGYKIVGTDREIFVKIEKNKIIIKMDYPLTVTKGNESYYKRKFNFEESTKFYSAYQYAILVNSLNNASSGYQPIGEISNLAYKNNFNFDIVSSDGEKVIYVIIVEDENRSLNYMFASKYSGGNNE